LRAAVKTVDPLPQTDESLAAAIPIIVIIGRSPVSAGETDYKSRNNK